MRKLIINDGTVEGDMVGLLNSISSIIERNGSTCSIDVDTESITEYLDDDDPCVWGIREVISNDDCFVHSVYIDC